MSVFDLGGQMQYRDSWDTYCSVGDVIIYVVDASDKDRLEEAKNELASLLEKDSLRGIPLLVLGNKNDLNDCLNEEEIIEKMDLRKVLKRKVCCYSVSAKNQNNLDKTMEWLTSLPKRNK